MVSNFKLFHLTILVSSYSSAVPVIKPSILDPCNVIFFQPCQAHFFIIHILSFDVFFSFSGDLPSLRCNSDVTLGSFNPSLSLQMISFFKNKWDSRLFEQKCHKWEV